MNTFDEFTKEVLEGMKVLAVGVLKNRAAELQADAMAFVESSEAKLKKWGELLRQGKIDEDDMAILVRSERGLARLAALTAVGVSAARLNRLRDQLIAIVTSAALKAFLP